MTKRDSDTANLPSPRQLRMESFDVEMPVVAANSYTTATPPAHDPLYSSQAASSHAPPVHPHDHTRPLQLPHALQPGEYRQRIGHTMVFKIVQESNSRYVTVEETDSEGYTKRKTLEKYFFGIIGHLRDRHGQRLDSWTLCAQLANYWREWFNVPTEGATFEPYEEPSPPSAPAPTPANTDRNQSSQIPNQILQVAWFLTALINTNQDTNARLIQELQEMPSGQPRDLHTDRVDHQSLANLSAHLGILADMLSQQQVVSQELADHSHEDDGI